MKNTKPLVVITGASSGIGEATAKAFSKLGHPLLLLARREDRLKGLHLPDTLTAKVDVTDRQSFCSAVALAEREYGPVDCLVNNAGVLLLGRMADQSPDEWQKMVDVNIVGVLNGVHAVFSAMTKRKTGTIINVSSIAGRKYYSNHAVYCGTKFAVHAMTDGIREEAARSNVRVITIAPGAVETELLGHTTDAQIKRDYEDWKKTIGTVLNSDDVARTILFAYSQPQDVCIHEIVLTTTKQEH